MKLAYKIPHKVTARMLGNMFVASCTCKRWAAQADPRKYDGMPGAWYPDGILPSPVAELIEAGHKHATDHVLDAHRLTRQDAA